MHRILPTPKLHTSPLHIIRRTTPSHQFVLPSTGSLQSVEIDLPVVGPLFGGLHGGFGGGVDSDLTGVEGVCARKREGQGGRGLLVVATIMR